MKNLKELEFVKGEKNIIDFINYHKNVIIM